MIKNDLRVLLISPLPPPAGGIASWTKQYKEWSDKNDLNVEIVNTAVIGKRAEKINHKTRIWDEIKRTNIIIKELKFKVEQYKPHIIHLNTPCGKFGIIRDYFCARIAKKNDIKLMVHYRCNVKDQVKNNVISNFFLKKLSNFADKNLVLNNSSSDYISQKTSRDTVIISNFINDDFVVNEPKNIREKIKIISFVGHVQRTKGILEIIEVAKIFPEIIFKLAGPVANEIACLEKPANVLFMGPLDKHQVKKLLISSDIFLFPSYTEGFANVMLEAMATGLPIIATPVGANIGIIESKGGIIVDVGNSDSIIKAINNLKGFTIRLEMSEWNLKKVKREYTIDKVMKKIISIYLTEFN